MLRLGVDCKRVYRSLRVVPTVKYEKDFPASLSESCYGACDPVPLSNRNFDAKNGLDETLVSSWSSDEQMPWTSKRSVMPSLRSTSTTSARRRPVLSKVIPVLHTREAGIPLTRTTLWLDKSICSARVTNPPHIPLEIYRRRGIPDE